MFQVMYAREVDERGTVFQKAFEVGDAYVLRTKVRVMYRLRNIRIDRHRDIDR